jgi:hypothetical protein
MNVCLHASKRRGPLSSPFRKARTAILSSKTDTMYADSTNLLTNCLVGFWGACLMDRRLSQLIFGLLIVSKRAKNLWVRVVKSKMDPFGRETYMSQTAPSRHVRKSRHKTASGYPNSLRRS